jgi:hypothetical protein
VRVRHGHGGDLDAGQHGHVRDLLAHLLVHLPDQLLAREYPAGTRISPASISQR